MEFCGVFYETGYLRAVYDRIRKLFFVFLMAAVLTVGMMGQGDDKFRKCSAERYGRKSCRRICGGSRNNRFFYDFGNRDSDFGRCFS